MEECCHHNPQETRQNKLHQHHSVPTNWSTKMSKQVDWSQNRITHAKYRGRTQHSTQRLLLRQSPTLNHRSTPQYHKLEQKPMVQWSKGKSVDVLSVKFKAAFRTVHPTCTIDKLISMGFCPSLTHLIDNFLSDRSTPVKICYFT